MKRIFQIMMVSLLLIGGSQLAYAVHYTGLRNTPATPTTRSVNAESCLAASATMDLWVNNVRARIMTGGDMWWNKQSGTGAYFVPGNSTKTSLYAASLWIAGTDVNGQLKCAAMTHGQGGKTDYWPGPLTIDGTASVDAAVCDQYDEFYYISRSLVQAFRAWFDNPQDYPDYVIPDKILDWPAHGDVAKGQSYYLAPFFDEDGDGTYDPYAGDYPYYDLSPNNDLCPSSGTVFGTPGAGGIGILSDQIIKGDETLWWVFNDKGNIHTVSLGESIGIEIRAQAFAFSTNDEINNMTFYSYEVINRSTYELTETYFSQWADPDLGFADDDYVGCDVTRGLGYCYNGVDIDGSGQLWAYGEDPPAVGLDFFQGPYMDNDGNDNPQYDNAGNQMCDESINGVNFGDNIVDNERFGMRRFVYHNIPSSGVPSYMQDPDYASEYYNFLRGIWKDGTKMKYGGNGHASAGGTGPECDFMFPGESDIYNWGTGCGAAQPEWTEVTAGNDPQDRRFMESAGPFTLKQGAVNYITVGVPWARASSGGAEASVELLKIADDKCQRLFDNCFDVVDGPNAPELIFQELDKELIFYITNLPSSNNVNESYREFDPSIISPDSLSSSERYDSIYVFEGYQIYQLASDEVSVTDLDDASLARLVAQCDVKNGVSQIVNFNYNDQLGANVPVEEVDGADEGVVHSYRLFNDAFATGDNRLVNNKRYYYMAVAYGYNNYLTYSQDPGNQIAGVSGLTGQTLAYLGSRINGIGSKITPYTVIPHTPQVENAGTEVNAEYGYGPKITRIEGHGNGSQTLELTEESMNTITSGWPNKIDNPTYENGSGPVNIKVVDPLNVVPGDYELNFDVNSDSIDYANWTLTNLTSGDIWSSDQSIAVGNEQLILEIGLSVYIEQVFAPGEEGSVDNGFISSEIIFTDSSQIWLTGVPDDDGPNDWNWIRSGTTEDPEAPDYDDYSGLDDDEFYEKILGGTWAPYRMCSKNGDYCPVNTNNSGNAAHVNADLAYTPNVDIVFTSDESKWTRCVVLEMCADRALSEGGVDRFKIRSHQSVDKDGNPAAAGSGASTNPADPNYIQETGMGWFPGYAVDVGTGERLNVIFGENSWLLGENGGDMMWNPTSNYTTDLGDILWGGMHFIYIVGHNNVFGTESPVYDQGQWVYGQLNQSSNSEIRKVYANLTWTGIPMLGFNQDLLSTDATIKFRVAKPYAKYFGLNGGPATPANSNWPLYRFSTDDIQTKTEVNEIAVSVLDLINIVPNPYYGFSTYETSQLDNVVRMTNLPEVCTVTIMDVSGAVVRVFDKDSDQTYLDWDLKNHANIPISGGMYFIHVNAPGIGTRTLKWFGSLRPVDLNSF